MILPSETSERFLRAITTQVPAERIAEIHVFAPIRQGGIESGVAVVAAWPDQPSEPPTVDTLHERELRPVVYTARYRLTLKGPDRGKWECTVTAEAEAPLGTVVTVVRGVQRRAGDADDATRLDGSEIRSYLDTHHLTADS